MKNAIGRTARRLVSTGPGVIVLVVAVAGVAYSAGGQSGGDGKRGPKPPPPPQLSDTQRQQLEAFRQCIQDQGIQRPQRGTAPTAADLAKLRAAQDACIDQFPDDLPYGFMMPPPGGPGGPGHHPPGPPPGGPQGGSQPNG